MPCPPLLGFDSMLDQLGLGRKTITEGMMTVTLVDDYRDNATMTLTMPTMMTTTTIITKYIVEPSAIVMHKGAKREREVTWLMAAESSL